VTMTRDDKLALGGLGVALAWIVLGSRPRASSSGSTTTTPPGGIGVNRVVPRVNTGTGPASAFDRDRYDALVVALAAHNAPAAMRGKLARAMLAHAITETGRRAEYNYNAWNMRPNANWTGDVFALPVSGPPNYERAYPDVQSAANDYANSITGARYGAILGDLAAGTINEADWYERVRLAGWSADGPSLTDLAEFNSILARLRAEFP